MMTPGVATAMSEEDRLIAAIDIQISSRERARAMLEPPWDGFCGLVKISDDEAFTTLEQGFIGRPREARPVKADTPDAASIDLSMDWPGEEGSSSRAGDSPLAMSGEASSSGTSATPSMYRRRVAASLSGASRSVAASITGAGSRVVNSLSGSLHAAAEEASRLLSSRAGREEDGGLIASGSSPVASRWKTPWRDASHHSSLASRLSEQLDAAVQATQSDSSLSPHETRPSAIANEAFKAATTAMEEGRMQEAKELAEVALRGVPSSKPRALAKVHALRARAEARLQEQAAVARERAWDSQAGATDSTGAEVVAGSDVVEGVVEGAADGDEGGEGAGKSPFASARPRQSPKGSPSTSG